MSTAATINSRKRMGAQRRLMSEMREEIRNPTPGIYVRHREDDVQRVAALVLGPRDTPYAGGFFRFSIVVPDTYPHTPPRVQLLTTDGGRVRFNPNLYACGRVCLSILGTWSGPPWNSCHTIATVLLSIQSLLNSAPIKNEPGLSGADERQVASYNRRVSYETLRVAVAEAMKHDRYSDYSLFRHHYERNFLLHFDAYNTIAKNLKLWLSSNEPSRNLSSGGDGVEVNTSSRALSGLESVNSKQIDALLETLGQMRRRILRNLVRPQKLIADRIASLSDIDSGSDVEEQKADSTASKRKEPETKAVCIERTGAETKEARTQRVLAEKECAMATLAKEKVDCSEHGSVAPRGVDLSIWDGSVFGPTGSPFEGGIFPVELFFPRSFPTRPPFIRFVGTPPYHPNITDDGIPSLACTDSKWDESTSISDLLRHLADLLSSPNMSAIVREEAGKLFMDDRRAFNRRVRDAVGT